MIKFLIFIYFNFLSFSAISQTEKGSLLLGGTGSVDLKNGLNAYASPQIGMFMAKNFAIGAFVPFSITSSKFYNSFYYGFGPFFRGYWGSSKIKGILEGGIYLATEHSRDTSDNREIKRRSTDNTAHLATGITYFINPNVGVEGMVKYLIDNDFEYTGGSLALNISFQIYLHKQIKGKNSNL